MTPEELRRARRAFVSSAHPDRGGDLDRFRFGLDEFDRLLRPSAAGTARPHPAPTLRVVVVRRPRGLAGWARHLARLPGSRRRRPARVR